MANMRRAYSVLASGLLMAAAAGAPALAQQAVEELPNPQKLDMFQLNDLESYRLFSQVKNF